MATESPSYASILEANDKKIEELRRKVDEKRSEIMRLEEYNKNDIVRLKSLAEELRADIAAKKSLLAKRRHDYKEDGSYDFKEKKDTDEKLINTVICEVANGAKVTIDYDDVVIDSHKKTTA